MKRHIVRDVPAIDRNMAPAIPVVVGLVVQCILKWVGTAPGIAEIVLRPRSESGRELLAIHEKLFITFAPPTASRIPDMKHHADKPASPLSFGDGPIYPALRFARKEGVAMPFGM